MLFVEWHPLQSYETAQKPPCKHASAWVAAFLVVVSKITQALASDLHKLRYAILSWTLFFSHGLVWAAQALAAAVSEHCWLPSTRVVTGEKATTKVLCIYFDLYPGAICITCARDATCPTHASGISLRVYLNLISSVFRLAQLPSTGVGSKDLEKCDRYIWCWYHMCDQRSALYFHCIHSSRMVYRNRICSVIQGRVLWAWSVLLRILAGQFQS